MRPIKYTNNNGETIFHYDYDSLRRFVYHGSKYGDVGKILVGRTGDVFHYSGYGTTENPNKTINRISAKHCDPFDGKMKTDDEIVSINETTDCRLESSGFAIINMKDALNSKKRNQ